LYIQQTNPVLVYW